MIEKQRISIFSSTDSCFKIPSYREDDSQRRFAKFIRTDESLSGVLSVSLLVTRRLKFAWAAEIAVNLSRLSIVAYR